MLKKYSKKILEASQEEFLEKFQQGFLEKKKTNQETSKQFLAEFYHLFREKSFQDFLEELSFITEGNF